MNRDLDKGRALLSSFARFFVLSADVGRLIVAFLGGRRLVWVAFGVCRSRLIRSNESLTN